MGEGTAAGHRKGSLNQENNADKYVVANVARSIFREGKIILNGLYSPHVRRACRKSRSLQFAVFELYPICGYVQA
jgi:hypothetical protein